MEYIRWYDKNPDLKEAFEFIQSLNSENQNIIAKDIIQILLTDFNLDLDKKINDITKKYNYNCKRWYDNNIDLFTSFEIIRGLPDEQQQEVVKKTIETILLMYLEEKVNK